LMGSTVVGIRVLHEKKGPDGIDGSRCRAAPECPRGDSNARPTV
jgi:hypothetical protein